MNKKVLLAIPLMAVVMVSGCIDFGGSDVQTTTGLGLEIVELSIDRTDVYSGSSARIFMEVENQGQSEVDKAHLYLIGNLGASGWVPDNPATATFDSISPADPLRDVPAERKRTSWKLTAPALSPGQSRTDQFTSRVYYPAKSTAQGTVWIYSEAEAEAARISGEKLSSTSFTYSKAPVSLEISVAPDPPVVEGIGEEFTMYVKIKNIGGGTVFDVTKWSDTAVPTLASTDLNKVSIITDYDDTYVTITGCGIADDPTTDTDETQNCKQFA